MFSLILPREKAARCAAFSFWVLCTVQSRVCTSDRLPRLTHWRLCAIVAERQKGSDCRRSNTAQDPIKKARLQVSSVTLALVRHSDRDTGKKGERICFVFGRLLLFVVGCCNFSRVVRRRSPLGDRHNERHTHGIDGRRKPPTRRPHHSLFDYARRPCAVAEGNGRRMG